MTSHFKGSTVGLVENTQSSLYSKQFSVVIQFPVVSLWSFLFVWFSDCANLNIYFSANSPPLSILHFSNKLLLIILSIQVRSISLSGQVTKGAEQDTLPFTPHLLIWSFPQLNLTYLIQLCWSFSDAECNHPCSVSLVWQASKTEFLSAELRSFLQLVNSIYRGSCHSFIFSGSSFIT